MVEHRSRSIFLVGAEDQQVFRPGAADVELAQLVERRTQGSALVLLAATVTRDGVVPAVALAD